MSHLIFKGGCLKLDASVCRLGLVFRETGNWENDSFSALALLSVTNRASSENPRWFSMFFVLYDWKTSQLFKIKSGFSIKNLSSLNQPFKESNLEWWTLFRLSIWIQSPSYDIQFLAFVFWTSPLCAACSDNELSCPFQPHGTVTPLGKGCGAIAGPQVLCLFLI